MEKDIDYEKIIKGMRDVLPKKIDASKIDLEIYSYPMVRCRICNKTNEHIEAIDPICDECKRKIREEKLKRINESKN